MSAVINPGDKVHVVTRRGFDGDVRRHLVGTVASASERAMRVEGYSFVHDSPNNVFLRSAGPFHRVVSIVDANNLITVLPADIEIAALRYESDDDRTVLTDGAGLEMGVNEFGALR